MKYLYVGVILLIAVFCAYSIKPKAISNTIHVKSNCKTQTLRRFVNDKKYLKDSLADLKYGLNLDDFNNPTLNLKLENKEIIVTLNNYQNTNNDLMLLGSYSIELKNYSIENLYWWYLNRNLKKQIKNIIEKICLKCGDLTFAYGGQIEQTTLKDSTLIYIKSESNVFPTTQVIYSKIQVLENYAIKNEAKPTNPPMLNINKKKVGTTFVFSVALPINKVLPPDGNIVPKRMLSGGKFLKANVSGGPKMLSNMELGLENYLSDYLFSSPAIPFQSLVTNRLLETDTSKWVTNLYYPIY